MVKLILPSHPQIKKVALVGRSLRDRIRKLETSNGFKAFAAGLKVTPGEGV